MIDLRGWLILFLLVGVYGGSSTYKESGELEVSADEDLAITGNIRIRIVLIGDGFIKQDENELMELLNATIPLRMPQTQHAEGEEDVSPNVRLVPIFSVHKMDSSSLVMAMNRRLKESHSSKMTSPYNLPITSLHDVLESYYIRPIDKSEATQGHIVYTHFIVDIPSSKFDLSTGSEWKYIYTVGKPSSSRCGTNHWVGQGRYILSDLSDRVIRCESGSVRNPSLHPTMQEEDEKSHRPSTIVRLVTSAVNQVLIPDLKTSTVHDAVRILVPVIVLRNHAEDIVFGPSHDQIRTTDIYSWIRGASMPQQEVHLLRGVHNIHEHHHISLSVSRCTKFRTFYRSEDKLLKADLKSYIDSSCMHHQLRTVEDILASGLIDHAESVNLYNDRLPGGVHSYDVKISEISLDSLRKKTKSQGVRVIPVYVLSLKGEDRNLEDNKVFSISDDSIIILRNEWNTHNERHEYCTSQQNERLRISTTSQNNETTELITRAVTSWLGGLMNPTTTASGELDYTWAFGYHPFHFGSEDVHLGQIYRDHCVRNTIFSRISASSRSIRKSTRKLVDFSMKYIHHPIIAKINEGNYNSMWIKTVLNQTHGDQNISPVARITVEHLNRQMELIHKTYDSISESLETYTLEEALQKSSALSFTAKMFKDLVHSEIEEAEATLFCCSLDVQLMEGTSWTDWIPFGVFTGLSFVIFFIT